MSARVLTPAPPASARPLTQTVLAYRCETTATGLTGSREVLLAVHRASTPRLAARWLRVEAERLARRFSLDPQSSTMRDAPLSIVDPTYPRPDDALRAWRHSETEYERAIRVLSAGDAYLISISDYDARYCLNAYPVPARGPSAPPAPAARSRFTLGGSGRHRRAPFRA